MSTTIAEAKSIFNGSRGLFVAPRDMAEVYGIQLPKRIQSATSIPFEPSQLELLASRGEMLYWSWSHTGDQQLMTPLLLGEGFKKRCSLPFFRSFRDDPRRFVSASAPGLGWTAYRSSEAETFCGVNYLVQTFRLKSAVEKYWENALVPPAVNCVLKDFIEKWTRVSHVRDPLLKALEIRELRFNRVFRESVADAVFRTGLQLALKPELLLASRKAIWTNTCWIRGINKGRFVTLWYDKNRGMMFDSEYCLFSDYSLSTIPIIRIPTC